jgi:hypothetical protein
MARRARYVWCSPPKGMSGDDVGLAVVRASPPTQQYNGAFDVWDRKEMLRCVGLHILRGLAKIGKHVRRKMCLT